MSTPHGLAKNTIKSFFIQNFSKQFKFETRRGIKNIEPIKPV